MANTVQMVCGHCGSASIARDAYARWDAERQEWSLRSVYDDATCDVCGCESCLEEMSLREWQEGLTLEHELEGFTYRAFKHHDGPIVAIVSIPESDVRSSVVARITGDTLGSPFFSLEEALDEARRRIMSGVIIRSFRRPEWPVPSQAVTHGS